MAFDVCCNDVQCPGVRLALCAISTILLRSFVYVSSSSFGFSIGIAMVVFPGYLHLYFRFIIYVCTACIVAICSAASCQCICASIRIA